MARRLIVTENLTKTYNTGTVEVHALKGVTVTLEEGEFVAVMGPSGSGKSTFLNLIGCLDHPSSGTYVLDGTDVSTMTDDELAAVRSRSIGFVFQGFNLLPRTSAENNIELPLVYSGERKREKPSRALLEAVGLPERGSHTPSELSGGEQQRVAIARSLINSPAIILADEPTGNLDSKMSDEIMDIFLSLNKAGITILMVTHEESVAAYAKRLVKFKDGVVVSDEPMQRKAQGSAHARRIMGEHPLRNPVASAEQAARGAHHPRHPDRRRGGHRDGFRGAGRDRGRGTADPGSGEQFPHHHAGKLQRRGRAAGLRLHGQPDLR
jgi:putative ABC transport system ATP-binding protein